MYIFMRNILTLHVTQCFTPKHGKSNEFQNNIPFISINKVKINLTSYLITFTLFIQENLK